MDNRNLYTNGKGEVVLIPNFGYTDPRFIGLCHDCGIRFGDAKTWPVEPVKGRCRCCGKVGWVTDAKYYGSPHYERHADCIVSDAIQ